MHSTDIPLKFKWRPRRTRIWPALFLLAVLNPIYAQHPPEGCKLLQPADLESALGGKAGKFVNSGDGAMCYGQVGSLKVMIRTGERKGDFAGEKEKKGIELARSRGVRMEVKTEGDLTCSTAIPPASLAKIGFNTTCSILRGGRVVAVEVTAPSEKEMASMDVVRKLVKKAFERL